MCVVNMFPNNLLWCIWMHNHEILWLKMYGKHFFEIFFSPYCFLLMPTHWTGGKIEKNYDEKNDRKRKKKIIWTKWKIIFILYAKEFGFVAYKIHTSISAIWTLYVCLIEICAQSVNKMQCASERGYAPARTDWNKFT